MKKQRTISSYAAKLKDPRWQRKRLEVMERKEFACEHCGDTESTLNVHHKAYKKNADPWDYECDELACLCDDCHEAAHELMAAVDDAMFMFRTVIGDERLLGYLEASLHGWPGRRDGIICRGCEHAFGVVEGLLVHLVPRETFNQWSDLVVDLAKGTEDGWFWPRQFIWNAASDVVIASLEYSIGKYPDWVIGLLEDDERRPCPKDIAEQFIARAKQALAEKDSIT